MKIKHEDILKAELTPVKLDPNCVEIQKEIQETILQQKKVLELKNINWHELKNTVISV